MDTTLLLLTHLITLFYAIQSYTSNVFCMCVCFYMVQCMKLLSYILFSLKYLVILIYVNIVNIINLKYFSNTDAFELFYSILGQICT